jgi:hypothetical protein
VRCTARGSLVKHKNDHGCHRKELRRAVVVGHLQGMFYASVMHMHVVNRLVKAVCKNVCTGAHATQEQA